MTKRKRAQYLSFNAEEPIKVILDQHHCHSRIGLVAVLQYQPPKCLCRRGSLSRSIASQTLAQTAFSQPASADSFSNLKAICAGVGWVWLARLASHIRLDTEVFHLFFVDGKTLSMSPKFKVYITGVRQPKIASRKLKPRNLILGGFHPRK